MIKFKRYPHKKTNTCKRLEEKKNKSNCWSLPLLCYYGSSDLVRNVVIIIIINNNNNSNNNNNNNNNSNNNNNNNNKRPNAIQGHLQKNENNRISKLK